MFFPRSPASLLRLLPFFSLRLAGVVAHSLAAASSSDRGLRAYYLPILAIAEEERKSRSTQQYSLCATQCVVLRSARIFLFASSVPNPSPNISFATHIYPPTIYCGGGYICGGGVAQCPKFSFFFGRNPSSKTAQGSTLLNIL